MKHLSVVYIAILGLLACGGADKNSNATVTKGEYVIVVSGDHDVRLEGDNVDTNWDPNGGFVFLNTDEFNEPLGTLTMTIGGQIDESIKEYAVFSALLSKTDVQVGTALELNSRLFEFIEGSITNVEIGSNFIRASLGLKMTRVLFYPDDEPEDVNVVGTFTAMSN
jgi:hypothetical protein